jgi:hypothetical protein
MSRTEVMSDYLVAPWFSATSDSVHDNTTAIVWNTSEALKCTLAASPASRRSIDGCRPSSNAFRVV